MRRASIGLILMILGLTSGCDLRSMLIGPDTVLYTISPVQQFDDNLPTVDWELVIAEITASSDLDTNNIILKPSAYQFTHVDDGHWVTRVAELMHSRLLNAFVISGHIMNIGERSETRGNYFQLNIRLNEFHFEMIEGGGLVRLALHAQLVAKTCDKPVAVQSFTQTQSVDTHDTPAIVAGFNIAGHALQRAVIAWTLTSGEDYRRRVGKLCR